RRGGARGGRAARDVARREPVGVRERGGPTRAARRAGPRADGGRRAGAGSGAGVGASADRGRVAGLTLDAGALIAYERGEPRIRERLTVAFRRGLVPTIPAVALAEVWCGDAKA